MEVLLCKNQSFLVKVGTEGHDTFFKIAISDVFELENNPSPDEYQQKICDATENFNQGGKNLICIHLEKNPANLKDGEKCLVRIHGFLWENLDNLWVEGLKIRVQLSMVDKSDGALQLCSEVAVAPPMSVSSESIEAGAEDCIGNSAFSEKINESFSWKRNFKIDSCRRIRGLN